MIQLFHLWKAWMSHDTWLARVWDEGTWSENLLLDFCILLSCTQTALTESPPCSLLVDENEYFKMLYILHILVIWQYLQLINPYKADRAWHLGISLHGLYHSHFLCLILLFSEGESEMNERRVRKKDIEYSVLVYFILSYFFTHSIFWMHCFPSFNSSQVP